VASAFEPEVVLLDIVLPGIDGYEVARRLREDIGTANALLVAVTGWGQERDRLWVRAAGFDHHLVKPEEPDTLRGASLEHRPGGARSCQGGGGVNGVTGARSWQRAYGRAYISNIMICIRIKAILFSPISLTLSRSWAVRYGLPSMILRAIIGPILGSDSSSFATWVSRGGPRMRR
jgi:CheY-like chemotaxis protein